MNHTEPIFEPLLVDVPTACLLLSVKRTKLFALLAEPDGLQRVKIGGKTLVAMENIRALAKQRIVAKGSIAGHISDQPSCPA